MTKAPFLVSVTLAVVLAGAAFPAKAATKSSSSSTKSKSAASAKWAAPAAVAKAKPTPSAHPKALDGAAGESEKATPAAKTPTITKAVAAGDETAPVKSVTEVQTTDAAASAEHEGGPAKKTEKALKPAAVSSMTTDELEGFDHYPPALQEVVRNALQLTTRNLRYQFGSSDPKDGGMDCSGTVCHVLQSSGISGVPRQSDEMCRWVMRHAVLYRTEAVASLKNPEFAALHPGDLLFWTGTYDTGKTRALPISHVMMYLGKRKKDGKPIVFGASDGRSFEGERRNGVSVFDFSLPTRGGKAAFYGYGPVPGLPKEESRPAIVRAVPAYAAKS